MTEKTLVLIFQNQGGDRVRLSVANAREDLQDLEVKNAMETIVSRNIFDSNGGDLVTVSGAEMVTRTVEEFSVK